MAAVDTLSPGARKQAVWALLNELASLLEAAHEPIVDLRDAPEGLNKWPLTADARGPLKYIAETVEALDAVGWQATIDRLNAEHGVDVDRSAPH